MKKIILCGLFIVMMTGSALAADVVLRWDAVTGATGYKIYQSTNLGSTWSTGTDVGNVTTRTVTGVIETGMVLFRISAYDANGEQVRTWSGAWYDHTKRPIATPGGAGIN
jgi:hypothetical protein